MGGGGGGGGGGGPDPCPLSGSAHGTGLCLHLLRYTETHFIVRMGFCTTLCVLSIDRQKMRVLFQFRHFFNSESSSTYFKDSCISLQKKFDRRDVLE